MLSDLERIDFRRFLRGSAKEKVPGTQHLLLFSPSSSWLSTSSISFLWQLPQNLERGVVNLIANGGVLFKKNNIKYEYKIRHFEGTHARKGSLNLKFYQLHGKYASLPEILKTFFCPLYFWQLVLLEGIMQKDQNPPYSFPLSDAITSEQQPWVIIGTSLSLAHQRSIFVTREASRTAGIYLENNRLL